MKWNHEKSLLITLPEFSDASSANHIIALFDEQNQLLGGASLWWSDVPKLESHTIGCIGSFHAQSEKICHQILEQAEEILSTRNITYIVGPMNGNTWRKHRFATFSNNRSPFALEPTNNHPDHPSWWQNHGYETLSNYSSSLIQLDGSQVTPERIRQRLIDANVSLHPLNMETFEQDLRSIYVLSVESFSNNFLYTPMDWPSFLSQYQQ
jgi:hypothetical protein